MCRLWFATSLASNMVWRLCPLAKQSSWRYASSALSCRQSAAIIEPHIIYLQREEVRLLPEGADQGRAAAHPPERPAGMNAELSEVLRTEVGQLMLFPVRPQILHRVQLRRVGGEELQP